MVEHAILQRSWKLYFSFNITLSLIFGYLRQQFNSRIPMKLEYLNNKAESEDKKSFKVLSSIIFWNNPRLDTQ